MSSASSSSSSSSASSIVLPAEFDVPVTHRLHAAYSNPLVRQWQSAASPILASELVYPIFVHDLDNEKHEIKSLPEQFRWGVNRLDELISPLISLGLRSIILFGVPTLAQHKDATASFATSPESPVARSIKLLKKKYPSLLIMVDICLCAYTSTGHCGITKPDYTIDNQPSIKRIAEMAVFLAQCGADIVAPSDMMDGRIGAIKLGLKHAGLEGRVSVMSYAAKFASVFYGPFRDAAGSGAKFGDRQGYQLPAGGRSLAVKAVQRDLDEGADFVMVKPGTPYLDIVRDVANMTQVPIAIYHVSGEYAMLWHAAAAGAFGLAEGVLEALNGAKRAGAKILITYFTPFLLNYMKEQMEKQIQAAEDASHGQHVEPHSAPSVDHSSGARSPLPPVADTSSSASHYNPGSTDEGVVIKPRQQPKDRGYDYQPQIWCDVQGQGVANDYGRFVGPGQPKDWPSPYIDRVWFSLALAGAEVEYTKPDEYTLRTSDDTGKYVIRNRQGQIVWKEQ